MSNTSEVLTVEQMREEYVYVSPQQILQILRQYDMTQKQFAEILLVSNGSVNKWINSRETVRGKVGGCHGYMARLIWLIFGGQHVYANVRSHLYTYGEARYRKRINRMSNARVSPSERWADTASATSL